MTCFQIKGYQCSLYEQRRSIESFVPFAASYIRNSMIDKTITIEDLVHQMPGAVSYLMRKGIKCIACGEPIWGTLESAAKEKGFSDEQIEGFVKELNELKLKPTVFK